MIDLLARHQGFFTKFLVGGGTCVWVQFSVTIGDGVRLEGLMSGTELDGGGTFLKIVC